MIAFQTPQSGEVVDYGTVVGVTISNHYPYQKEACLENIAMPDDHH
jgi:hypothetical protein